MIEALAIVAALNVFVGNSQAVETEGVKPLDEVKNLQVFGDFITIASKNLSGSNAEGCDDFEQYVRTHVIRIKAPLLQDKYFNFELRDLIPNEAEGRKKGMRLREVLLPLLVAIKYKLGVVLPIFMAIAMAIALKGFWAGITGLFISKLVALKVLLQSQNKRDDDDEGQEETDHHHSYEIPSQNAHEEEHEDRGNPVIIHLHSDGHGGRFSRRRDESLVVRQYYNPKRWDPWG